LWSGVGGPKLLLLLLLLGMLTGFGQRMGVDDGGSAAVRVKSE
jgi:hypothetical protein